MSPITELKILKTNCTTYDNEDILQCQFHYPIFRCPEYLRTINEINRYYKLKILNDLIEAENTLTEEAMEMCDETKGKNFPVHSYQEIVTYETTLNECYLLSLYFDNYEYKGGANGITSRSAQTYDVHSNRQLTLSQICNCDDYVLDKVITESKTFPDFFGEDTITDNFNEENFYLTETGLVIFYQESTVAPHYYGIVTFELPYDNCIVKPDLCNVIV